MRWCSLLCFLFFFSIAVVNDAIVDKHACKADDAGNGE